MNCAYHLRNPAAVQCSRCAKPLCPACDHRIRGFPFCQDCIVAGVEMLQQQSRAALTPGVVRRKSSPFVATLLSIVPGLGAASLPARLAAWLRDLLDPIISPQLATVATMLLVAVMVLTSTVSADGSISGMYQASLQLAERTYAHGATTAVKGAALSGELKQIADGVTTFMTLDPNSNSSENEKKNETPKTENSPATKEAGQKNQK